MSRWIRDLPKPIGLLACDDDRGREVMEACRAAGAQVPEDVAVMGVDNDELLCDLSDPPLSSVAFDTERAGYEAAALLGGLMLGRIREPRRILVEPMYVVARRSTDVLALDDRAVAAALRFIHDTAGRPIGVGEVIRQVPLSRRTLELRFRRVVGRSIHEEIQRVRLERARQLVAETDLSIGMIAENCGFAGAGHLTRSFARTFGLPPSRYRAQHRHGS
jgi:LacI family transcriptional regulator